MLAKIITLGCKVNQYESEAMMRNLNAAGFKTAEENQNADIIIVNSCAVTSVSEHKAQKWFAEQDEKMKTLLLFLQVVFRRHFLILVINIRG